MTRRAFLQGSAVGAAAMTTFLHGQLARAQDSSASDLDRFGGLKSVRFEATGFFRVEKAHRWWFVTPDGSAFLSFGLNHPNLDYIQQPYNVEYWKSQFGAENVSDPKFREGFVAKVMRDLDAFGMNTIGCHAIKEQFGTLTVPYVQALFFVRTPYWMFPAVDKFPDVFSPRFRETCERVAERAVRPRRDDPYLMGYVFTDCPILTDRDADAHGQVSWGRAQSNMPTWPRVLRNLGGEAPGKQIYMTLARDGYATIRAFNRVYGTSFASFDDLSAAADWSPVVRAEGIDDADDNRAFLKMIVEQYYKVACSAIRRFDANHLIFGDVLNAQTTTPDEIVKLTSQYTDLVAYQFYDGYDEQKDIVDRWSKRTGKPLFHADSCFSVAYDEMPAPIGAVCPDTETRAQRFLDFGRRAFARPDFIGWSWCGWMDMWAAWKADRQHSGLQDPFGHYHDPMPETMSRFGSQLYDYARGAGDEE